MAPHAVAYATFLLISAGVSALSALFIWPRRFVSGSHALLALMLSEMIWSGTYAIYWMSATSSARLFWLDATYLGVVVAPSAFFVFVLGYTYAERQVTRRNLLILAIEPILTLVLLWTDRWHGLFFAGQRTAELSAILDGGPWFWVHILYSYGLLLIACVLLIRFALKAQKPFRRQAGLLVIAALLPWAGNVISILKLNPLPGLDLTPLIFTSVGLIFTYSLFRLRLLKVIPVARDTVVERMHDGVIVVDGQRQIVDVNPAAARLLHALDGQADGVLIGQPLARFLRDLGGQEKETVGPLEIRRTIDGRPGVFRLRISPLLDRKGRPQGSILVLQNISELSRKSDEIARNRNYLQAIFDGVDDAILVFDAETGEVLDLNHRACELFGYPRAAILGTYDIDRFSAGVPPYSLAEARQWMVKARTDGPQVIEWLARHANGTLFWTELRVRHALFGDQTRVIVSANDITLRKQAEQRAFELALEKERVQILSHFIQDAAHEFRTPLAIIQSSLYLLDRMEDPTRRQEKSEQIHAQVGRITRLVSILASLAALDSGLPLELEPLDLNELADQLVARVQASQAARGLTFRLDLDSSLPTFPADFHRLQEALDQLLDNAVRFSPPGSTIAVATRQEGDRVTLEIADSGPGIAPEALPRVFERFYRQDNAHSTPGFGLGLPIARKIAEAHQGQIEIASQPGAGTTVRVTLPLVPNAQPVATDGATP